MKIGCSNCENMLWCQIMTALSKDSNADKRLIDMNLTELLDMIHQPNKIGTKSSTPNEIDNSPIEQHPSPLTGESSKTAPTKQKRKAPEAALDRDEKKRQVDKAYRLRCKEKKEKNEQDMVVLTEENNKLERENEQLKREGVKQSEMVRTQNEEMKELNRELLHLKHQLQIQNTVVDVLSSKVASGKDSMDLQHENRQLRLVKSLLIKKINNDDYSNLIQLQEKCIKLEQEKNTLQVIIDALCAKSNKDNDLKTNIMEDATANMWGMLPETLSPADAGGLNTWLFMEPSPSASAELVRNQFPKTTDANLNTQVSGATRYTAARKKRLHDKAYRERCKELKMNTKIKMDELTKENDRLRRENDSLKKEQVLLVHTLQHQKDEMKQLQIEFGKLEDQLSSRNMVVEVLLKQSTGSNNKDLQRENALLKHCFNQLTKEISNQENINENQLRAKIEHLENKKHSLQVIIDALCEKIKDDQDRAAWTS
ncbi:hypothetical protein SADUNF_Sadunf03G0117400 [Salix dunnii]|uniref:Uncharacterized protein n=1 Tax=Salix dunnii TaxID=1413687 RepID=A0A835N4D7_9ROSI|nr:hypothetical protein SADUNF_Sadunf03G0117400 [Salix dunnii]